jgi:hypothetical protein
MDATIVLDQVNFIINESLQGPIQNSYLSGAGKSEAKGLTNFAWSMSNLAFSDSPNHMLVSNGVFELINDSGDVISGTYEGEGSLNDLRDLCNADLTLTIISGTGSFAGSKGTMSAVLRPFEEDLSAFVLSLRSEIFREYTTALIPYSPSR